MPQASAFQFYARIDGLALSTSGFAMEWNGVTTLPINDYITPIGLAIGGLAVGQADFWQYLHLAQNANWQYADL